MSPGGRRAGRQALEGVRAIVSAVEPPPAPVQAFLRLVDDRALGLRAAVRLPGRAGRHDARRRPGATGSTCCSSRSRWSGRARSRWPPTGSSTGTSTRRTRAPPSVSWSPARCRVRTAWIGAVGRAGRLPRRRGRCSTRCAWLLAPLARGPAGRLPVRQALHQLAARDPGAGPGGRAGRRLARGDRHVRWLRAGVRARRRGRAVDRRLRPASTPARTPRSTGGSASRSVPARYGVRGRAAHLRRWRTW